MSAQPNDTSMVIAKLVDAVRGLLDVIDTGPEPNCSCHLSPPCSDCVDWAAPREAAEDGRAALAFAGAQA